ncbi:MAG: mitochondrial fission ELM1 family protein [Proteobacteria bacterium]|nr:mitochondrial fission ELM1 family protein [Pseudomonadota bacterium]
MLPTSKDLPLCWVVCDEGKVGTQNQCVGLAEGLGYEAKVIPVRARFPWSLLPAHLWPCPLKGLEGGPLSPPWPDLIIAAGRASVAPTAAIRRITGGRTRVIQMQNPRVSARLFDAIISPRHDGLTGSTIIETKGALHRVTRARLQEEGARFAAKFAHLPRPYTAVLVGGTNRCYTMAPKEMQALAEMLKEALTFTGGALLVSISRRTAPENTQALKDALHGVPTAIWDGEGDNPYFGFLGLADFVVVTCDSVSMTSEACATGKPVYSFDLPGGSRKFSRFHTYFRKLGLTRPFEGRLDAWDNPPLEEMDQVIGRLKEILNPKD